MFLCHLVSVTSRQFTFDIFDFCFIFFLFFRRCVGGCAQQWRIFCFHFFFHAKETTKNDLSDRHNDGQQKIQTKKKTVLCGWVRRRAKACLAVRPRVDNKKKKKKLKIRQLFMRCWTRICCKSFSIGRIFNVASCRFRVYTHIATHVYQIITMFGHLMRSRGCRRPKKRVFISHVVGWR